MQTIQIVDGQNKPITLISGLEWHPVKEAGLKRNGEIRSFAKEQGFNLKVVRGNNETTHAGYARKLDGAREGFVSLAACVCDRISKATGFGAAENILVAIKLPNETASNWCFVSSRNGVILADGDFTADEVTVRERLTSDSKFSLGWDAIICPSEWDVPRSTQYEFEYFFATEVRSLLEKQGLSEVFINKRLFWLTTVAVLAVLLSASYVAYQKHLKAQFEAKQKALAAEKIRNEKKLNSTALIGILPPLTSRDANTISLAKQCDAALQEVPLSAGGWRLGLVECETSGLTAHWQKNGAPIVDFLVSQPNASINTDGTAGSLKIKIGPVSKPEESIDKLWSKSTIIVAQKVRSEAFGYEYKGTALKPRVTQKTTSRTSAQPMSVITFEATSSLDVVDLANLISAPGVRAQRIVFSIGDGNKKTIHGVQYGK